MGGDVDDAMAKVSTLYASDSNGKPVVLTETGRLAPDGGTFTEFGVPSVGTDGTILFAAETSIFGAPSWHIFSANVRRAAVARVESMTIPDSESASCSPLLKNDVYPVGDGTGAIAFIAPTQGGSDAIFLVNHGRFECVAHTGDFTNHNRRIVNLGFGSLQMGAAQELIFEATVVDERDAPVPSEGSKAAQMRRPTRRSILSVSPGRNLTEIATERDDGPSKRAYGPIFGLPAAVNSDGRTLIAFINYSQADGGAAFLYRDDQVTQLLSRGTDTNLGRVKYVSVGRPALSQDGTVALSGTVDDKRAVIRVASEGPPQAVLLEGRKAPGGSHFAVFGDPALTASGSMIFGALDNKDRDWFYVLDDASKVRPLAPVCESAKPVACATPSSVMSGTLYVNQSGDFAFLGGAIKIPHRAQ